MCGPAPDWKREEVPDHKFDFVDTREFTDNGFFMRLKYLFLYLILLKSFLVYCSDIFSATTMLTTDGWSNDVFDSCPQEDPKGCVPIDFNIGKWVFFGCICFSFLLLAYEARKSRKIIKSRDISYAFTNVMANNYYSLRSYDHFCFFDHISNSTKKKDDYAFFVFFTFKGWKRLLLADGPRQAINAITLYSFYLSKEGDGDWDDFGKYFRNRDLTANIMTGAMLFTVLVFAGSLLLLIIAGVCYVPLLCYIQGNLKEYCCHKVDKRIAEIIRRRNKRRHAEAVAQAQKEAEGDFSHLKGRSGGPALPQPTLPNISLDDEDDTASQRTRAPPSTYTGGDGYYYNDQKAAQYDYNNGAEYPPMPGYGHGQGDYGQYGHDGYANSNAHLAPAAGAYDNPSLATVYGEREPYFNDHAHAYGGEYDPYGQQHQQHPAASEATLAHPQPAYGHDDQPAHPYNEQPQDYPSPTSAGPPGRFANQQQLQPQAGMPPLSAASSNPYTAYESAPQSFNDHRGPGGGGYAI